MLNDMQKFDATEIGRGLGTRSPVAMEKEMQSPDSGAVAVGNAQVEAGAIGSMPSRRRRKLVKGALTAPMILTLYSGAALARTSNEVTAAQTLEQATIGSADSPHLEDQGKAVCAANCEHTGMGETCDLGEMPAIEVVDLGPGNQYKSINDILKKGCPDLSNMGENPTTVVITASSAISLIL